MSKLTVVFVVKNEADRIAYALESVSWADEIIVLVDSDNTDNTVDVANRFGAKVCIASNPRGSGYIGYLRRLAQSYAGSPWILVLDADERVPEELAQEIKTKVANNDQTKAYAISRLTFFMGRFLYHTWRPDYVLRLYPKDQGRYDDKAIHEEVVLTASIQKIEYLKNYLEHYHCRNLKHFITKIHRYADAQADEKYIQGKKVNLLQAYVHAMATFGKNYLLKRGFLDGITGLLVASLSAYSTFLKYVMLWAKKREKPAKT